MNSIMLPELREAFERAKPVVLNLARTNSSR
jgi:hypothetical protein